MTSRPSSSEPKQGGISLPQLVIKLLRRNVWLPLLAFIGFMLALPVVTALIYNAVNPATAAVTYASRYFVNDMMQIFQVCTGLIIIVGAVLAAFVLFHYLHARSQVDFYHSLPIRREKLFAANWLTGFLVFLAPFAAAHLVNLLLLAVFGMLPYVGVGFYLKYAIFNVLAYALMFSLAVVAMLLSGNLPGALKILAGTYGLCPAIAGLIAALGSLFYTNYVAFSDAMTNGLLRATVLGRYIVLMADYAGEGMGKLCWQDWAFGGILLALAVLAGLLLYQRRRSECAGSTLAFRWQKPLFKYPYVILFGVLGGIIFYAVSDGSAVWAGFGAVLATLFMAQLLEIFVNTDFRAIRRGWRAAFASLLAVALILAYYGNDWGGFDAWRPQADAVASVEISGNMLNISGGYNNIYTKGQSAGEQTYWQLDLADRTMVTLSDPANVAALVSIVNSQPVYYGAADDEGNYYTTATSRDADIFVFNMKNGSRKTRSLDFGGVMYNEAAYLTLLGSREYHDLLAIYDSSFDAMHVAIDHMDPMSDYGTCYPVDKLGEEMGAAVLAAYRSEYAALTPEQLLKSLPVARLEFDFYTEKTIFESGGYQYENMQYVSAMVYPEMTQTCALLQEMFNFDPLLADRQVPEDLLCVREVKVTGGYHPMSAAEQATFGNSLALPYDVTYLGEPKNQNEPFVYFGEEKQEVVRTYYPSRDAEKIKAIFAETVSSRRLRQVEYYNVNLVPLQAGRYYQLVHISSDYDMAGKPGAAILTPEEAEQLSQTYGSNYDNRYVLPE